MIGIYVRESSDKQRDNWSNKTQIAEGLKFATECNSPYKIYEDIKSGKAGSNRPEWEKLKADIARGVVTTLYFWKYARLGRDAEENERIKKLLIKHNVKFYEAEHHSYLDLNNSGTDLITSIQGKIAEIDNKTRTSYILDSLHTQYDSGNRRYTGNLYGYYAIATIMGAKVQRTWHINEEEANIIRMIYKLALEDRMGLSAISRYLGERGIRTRKGLYWSHDKVRQVLRRPVYAGFTTNAKGEYIKSNVYPSIITEEEWRRMIEKYPEFVTALKTGRPHEHIGSGIVECACCGSKYTFWKGFRKYTKADGTVSTYPKITYLHVNRNGCNNQSTYQTHIIEQVIKLGFANLLSNKQSIIENMMGESGEDRLLEDRAILMRQIDKLKKEIDNLGEAIALGVDMSVLTGKIKDRSDNLKDLESKLGGVEEEIQAKNNSVLNTINLFAKLKLSEFNKASDKEKNSILSPLVRVKVEGDSIKVVYGDGTYYEDSYSRWQAILNKKSPGVTQGTKAKEKIRK